MRAAVEYCSDCTSCQDLMEDECRFFAQLFPLEWLPGREPIPDATIRELADACTYCGLCPCPEIPAHLMEGKSAAVAEEGQPLSTRLLTDVPRLARACGTFPRVYEALESSAAVQPVIRRLGGLHPDRAMPRFARESFFAWAKCTGRTTRPDGVRRAAYFAGCTVGYLFPEVGQAVVAVLERNGVAVYVPPQECCGMPFLVEGDQARAVGRAQWNVERLLDVRRGGDDIVASCPTCGFYFKVLLRANTQFARDPGAAADTGAQAAATAPGEYPGGALLANAYQGGYVDDGAFAGIPAAQRVAVADAVVDTGDYLARLDADGRLDTDFGPVPLRVAYFPPCHLRTQQRERPYADILRRIPGLALEIVGEDACCGMGGNAGFKKDVHQASLDVGRPLFEAIERAKPDAIVTDCLSCRLQFDHAVGIRVFHPMEIIARAYGETAPGQSDTRG